MIMLYCNQLMRVYLILLVYYLNKKVNELIVNKSVYLQLQIVCTSLLKKNLYYQYIFLIVIIEKIII